MKTLGLCVLDCEEYGVTKGNIYLLDILENWYDLYINRKEKYTQMTSYKLNIKHFNLLHNEIELIEKLKQGLSINDNDILQYTDNNHKYKYWIRYKSDLISVILSTKFDLPCTVSIEIKSNNHIRDRISINNYMTDDGIKYIINQLKFLYELSDNQINTNAGSVNNTYKGDTDINVSH